MFWKKNKLDKKNPYEETWDLEEIFYWFCRNHNKDISNELATQVKQIKQNLLENEKIFDQIQENGEFEEFINMNSKSILSIEENYEYVNQIFKWYNLYFFSGTDSDIKGPLSLKDALNEHYITLERDNDELVDIEFDKNEITWDQVQEIMTCNKPSIDSEIRVNDKTYIHTSDGVWELVND